MTRKDTAADVTRRNVALGVGGLLLSRAARGQVAEKERLRIGVLGDFSGPYSAIAGEGTVVAARLAVADFGGTVLGRPVEIVSADHGNKVDTGLAIVREWFGPGNVAMVTNVTNSAIAFGIQPLLTEAHRIAIYSTAGNADLVGKFCSPLSAVWAQDTWSSTVAPIRALLKKGVTTFFLVAADYAFGKTLEADAAEAIIAGGGKVLGIARHPINASDFSSFLLAAHASGAQVVMLLNGGSDFVNSYKQAVEFDLPKTQTMVAPIVFLTDIDSLGLDVAQGLQFAQSWYWDLNDGARAWSRRYAAERNRMPGDTDAATYSAVLAYLRAVKAAGTDSAEPVMTALKAMTVSDLFTSDGHVREDGRLMLERYIVQVKKPSESKGPWDYLEIMGTISAAEGSRPLRDSACRFVKA